MTELKYNIKYPEYNLNYHINKDLFYHCTKYLDKKCSCINCVTTSLLPKYKKNNFGNKCTQTENTFSNNNDSSNKCTQTENTFQNRTFSNSSDSSSSYCSLGSPLTRLNSIFDYDSDEKKEEEYKKIKSKIEKVERNILVEDVEEEKEFVTIGERVISVKEIEKCIFLDEADERLLCEMPEEYQEMKRVYMEIME